MKMNKKQTISVVVAIIGVILLFFAFHAKGKISSAGETVNEVTSPFSSTPAGGMVRHSADNKLAGYAREVQWIMIGGFILLVGGGVFFYMNRKKGR